MRIDATTNDIFTNSYLSNIYFIGIVRHLTRKSSKINVIPKQCKLHMGGTLGIQDQSFLQNVIAKKYF